MYHRYYSQISAQIDNEESVAFYPISLWNTLLKILHFLTLRTFSLSHNQIPITCGIPTLFSWKPRWRERWDIISQCYRKPWENLIWVEALRHIRCHSCVPNNVRGSEAQKQCVCLTLKQCVIGWVLSSAHFPQSPWCSATPFHTLGCRQRSDLRFWMDLSAEYDSCLIKQRCLYPGQGLERELLHFPGLQVETWAMVTGTPFHVCMSAFSWPLHASSRFLGVWWLWFRCDPLCCSA